MKSNAVLWVVGTQVKPGVDEEKFNQWYDEVHIPMLLKGDYCKRVSRSLLAPKAHRVASETHECPKCLTIYEFESEEKFEAWMTSPYREDAGRDKLETWGPEGGYEVFWATRYDSVSEWT